MRIDKFLWCVRVSKTRSEATNLCNKERVKIDNEVVKPSRHIIAGQVFSYKEAPIWRSFKVLEVPKSRIGNKLLVNHLLEITKDEDLMILEEIKRQNRTNYLQGIKGRPTKKDRRDLDDFKD